MEEKRIDRGESQEIKLNQSGQDGSTEQTAAIFGETEEDPIIQLPMDETDEDLIGLSPTQLEEELKRRARAEQEARAERDRLLEEGERLLKKGEYESAEPFFSQALLYDADSRRAKESIWICRTKNFQTPEAIYRPEYKEEFFEMDDELKKFMRKSAQAWLEEERDRCESEAKPLRERVNEAQSKRRDVFLQNRDYYRLRFWIVLSLLTAFLIAAGVSAFFIVRTKSNLPVLLTAVFGLISLAALVFTIFFTRRYYVAARLVRENEKLSSTEDGARLKELNGRLARIEILLDV